MYIGNRFHEFATIILKKIFIDVFLTGILSYYYCRRNNRVLHAYNTGKLS